MEWAHTRIDTLAAETLFANIYRHRRVKNLDGEVAFSSGSTEPVDTTSPVKPKELGKNLKAARAPFSLRLPRGACLRHMLTLVPFEI